MEMDKKENLNNQEWRSSHYDMNGLLDYFIKAYYLEDNDAFRATFKKKILDTCKNIKIQVSGEAVSLLDKSAPKKTDIKRRKYIFTESEKELLRSKLLNYMYERSQKKELLKEQIEAEKNADEMNKKEEEFMHKHYTEQESDEDDSPSFPSFEEFRFKKFEIMLEAIYLKFFTPINENKLWDDMALVASVAGTTDHTPESEAAFIRLKNPSIYYTEKKQTVSKKTEGRP